MTTGFRSRPFRRAALRIAAGISFIAAANAAVASDDSGVHAFLSNIFGEAGGAPPPASDPSLAPVREHFSRHVSAYRPLTIRPRFRPSTPHVVAAVGPTKPGKVSIYQDPTLRKGDAVMTADGIRIFAGATSWPYAKSDFVPLGKARDLSHSTVSVLAGLDSLPRT